MTFETQTDEHKKAFLISAFLPTLKKEDAKEHLEELKLLVETYQAHIVGAEICPIRNYDVATYITKGKLEEMIKLADAAGATIIIFDDEISPSQQKNLEDIFKRPVIDRTEVILSVFAMRAQTREARLQIELAHQKYIAPRLKRMWTHLSRQAGTGSGGGGGYTKGEGEKQIEIDRRILKDKIDDLQKELEEVRANRQTLRGQRLKSQIPVFAIIGYTNAGKSTLLNALTSADVLVEDKLFATLDTTTRKFELPNNQDILLIDTVGFIRKLPHLLVAAFKSTLEEAVQADILIHLIDVSHPMAFEQAATTFEVLNELNAEAKPILTVLNKVDKLQDLAVIERFRVKYPHVVPISALNKSGFADLEELMIKELSKLRKTVTLTVPQSDYATVSQIIREGRVISQDYQDNNIIITAEIPIWLANKLIRS